MSAPFRICAEHFALGQTRNAIRAWPRDALVDAGDHILLCDILRAAGTPLRAMAVARRALRAFPHDPRVLVIGTAAALAAHRPDRVRALAERIRGDAAGLRALRSSRLATAASAAGLGETARAHAADALAAGPTDPVVLYGLIHAALHQREFDEAIRLGETLVTVAPRWQRARLALCDALLARGRSAAAADVLRRAIESGDEDANVDVYAWLQAVAVGDFAAASRLALAAEERWAADAPRLVAQLAPLVAFSLWSSGSPEQVEGARARIRDRAGRETTRACAAGSSAKAESVSLWQRMLARTPARRRVLTAPLIAQERRMCLPTAVAMCAATQGVAHDPRELFAAMRGENGAPMWRAIDVMRRRGFAIHHVAARLDVVRHFIDAGIPVVGQLEGLFANHVEVVAGYDDALESVIIRDPSAWQPALVDCEALSSRYAAVGDGLVAFVAPGVTIDVHEAMRCPVAEALNVLSVAVAKCDRAGAEAAAACVPDGPAAFTRDAIGIGVTLSPRTAAERLRRAAASSPSPLTPVQRLRAGLAGLLDNSDATQAELRSLLGARLFALVGHARRGEWNEVVHVTEALIDSGAPEHIWGIRVEALLDLGRTDEARAALALALQINPADAGLRRLDRLLAPHAAPFARQLADVDSAIVRAPDDHALHIERAALLRMGPDGVAYELAARDLIRRRPRDPECWRALAGWYADQGRADLADALLADGRTLLPEDLLVDAGESSRIGDDDSVGTQLAGAAGLIAKRDLAGARGVLDALKVKGRLPWRRDAQLSALSIVLAARETGGARDSLSACIDALAPAGPTLLWLDELVRVALACGLAPGRAGAIVRLLNRHAAGTELPPSLALNWAQIEAAVDRRSAAERRVLGALGRAPHTAQLRTMLAMLAAERGATEEAAEHAEVALAGAPGDVRALRLRGRLAEVAGDEVRTRQSATRLCAVLPYDVDALYNAMSLVAGSGSRPDPLARSSPALRNDAERETLIALVDLRGNPAPDARLLSRLQALAEDVAVADPIRCFASREVVSRRCEREERKDAYDFASRAAARFPSDPWLAAVQADLALGVGGESEGMVRARLLQAVARGVFNREIAQVLLALLDASSAISAISECPAEHRGGFVRTLVDAALEANHRVLPTLLTWIDRHADEFEDEAVSLRAAFVLVLVGRRQVEEARGVFERLARAWPDDPSVIDAEIEVMAAISPEAGLAVVRRRLGLEDSAGFRHREIDLLLRLGRRDEAAAVCRAVLADAPQDPFAMVGLVRATGERRALAAGILAAVERDGELVPMLHVIAIDCARATHRSVPEAWVNGAFRRTTMYHLLPAADGEENTLAQALLLWLSRAGAPEAELFTNVGVLDGEDDWLPARLRASVPSLPEMRGAGSPSERGSVGTRVAAGLGMVVVFLILRGGWALLGGKDEPQQRLPSNAAPPGAHDRGRYGLPAPSGAPDWGAPMPPYGRPPGAPRDRQRR